MNYNISYNYYTAANIEGGQTLSLLNRGQLRNQMGEYSKAIQDLERALKLARDMENIEFQARALNSLGFAYLNTNRYDQAFAHLRKSLDLSRSINLREWTKDTYNHLAETHSLVGNHAQAYNYQEKFITLKDSLFNETTSRNIADMRIKYETAKKEKENAILRKEKEVQEAMLSKNRTITVLISLMLLVVLVSFGFVYRANAKNKEINRLLEQSNQEITRQRDALEEKNAELEQAIQKVQTLRGLLPICAHCKKIRDDEGYWQEVDSYITHHSEAVFSRGICPDCIREFYPEYAGKYKKPEEGDSADQEPEEGAEEIWKFTLRADLNLETGTD